MIISSLTPVATVFHFIGFVYFIHYLYKNRNDQAFFFSLLGICFFPFHPFLCVYVCEIKKKFTIVSQCFKLKLSKHLKVPKSSEKNLLGLLIKKSQLKKIPILEHEKV